jgi:hypothetical protein
VYQIQGRSNLTVSIQVRCGNEETMESSIRRRKQTNSISADIRRSAVCLPFNRDLKLSFRITVANVSLLRFFSTGCNPVGWVFSHGLILRVPLDSLFAIPLIWISSGEFLDWAFAWIDPASVPLSQFKNTVRQSL